MTDRVSREFLSQRDEARNQIFSCLSNGVPHVIIVKVSLRDADIPLHSLFRHTKGAVDAAATGRSGNE